MSEGRTCAVGAAVALSVSGCFGALPPEATATDASSTTGAVDAVTSTGLVAASSDGDSSSGAPLVCEHLDILVLTDVSGSMAPLAGGIINVLLAIGTRIEEAFEGVGTFNIALGYNVAPVVNQQAYEIPAGGEGCTQLGALVRGVDECAEDFELRPYLTDDDDLGAGLTCLGGGLISAQWDPSYETPRTLDSIVALLEAEDDPALTACNEDFHRSPDPLLIVLIIDAEDESEASVLEAVTSAVATQGTSLENVGLFLIGADASGCPDDDPNACDAHPSCRVQEFIDRGFTNVGLGENVRRFNICRSLERDSAAVADDLLVQMTAVVQNICTP
ncbi:MAG: hypothetical protein ACE37F_30710 [Nannocystaceae bacterium]|nr:hypothetical protein [bacterium]